MKYIKLIRAKHYIKNLLIYLPLVFNGTFFNLAKLETATLGFIIFCFISSVVYIINDLKDLEKDKLHPTKCKRPLAAGLISSNQAITVLIVLLLLVACLSLLYFPASAIAYPLLYLVLNIAYSYGLKNQPLIDVTILSSGFLLRIIYGGIINDIKISNWLFLTILAMALFFSLGKRRNEIMQSNGTETRSVLKRYPIAFLDKSMYMCLTLGNVFYALWSMDNVTEINYHNFPMIYSFPIVLLITLRYCLLIEGESDGDPIEVVMRDKMLLLLCLLYIIVIFIVRYA